MDVGTTNLVLRIGDKNAHKIGELDEEESAANLLNKEN